MAGLRLEHIYKVYPNGTKAVSDFTMEIHDEEFIVFVGPSGCGKSTTLRMIAGLEDISAGELYIGDRIVNDVEPKDRDIAMVFQNYALYPHMTVYENMAFGLKLRKVPNAEIHEKVLWAARILDLTEYLDRKPKAMSGGQRQRVALGRAILRSPKVMLLDEPLSNLDAKLRAQMRSEIAKLHDELKTTFIYVTHDQVEAMTLGTRVVVMKLGRIMQIDTPKNLYDYPNNQFVAGFIGTPQMNFFQATLEKKKDMIHVQFMWSNTSLDIPQSMLAKVKPQYFDGKTPVIIGLRCEHLSLEPEIVQKSEYLIDVKISHFEELGNETLIYGDINEQGDGFKESSTRVIIKGTSNYGLKKDMIVKAAVQVNKIHMFDKETEQSINPRIPEDNLVSVAVKDKTLTMGKLSYAVPEAIQVADGEYEVFIPSSAVEVVEDKTGSVKLASCEFVEGTYVVGVDLENQLLYTTVAEELDVKKAYSLKLDFTQLEFRQQGIVIQKAISPYDQINAVFLNHLTAKTFVGDRYDGVVAERLSKVDNIYLPQIENLNKEYELQMAEASKVDSASVVEKNKASLAEKKETLVCGIAKIKEEYSVNSKKLMDIHKQNNIDIEKKVNDAYAKIRADEMESFENFKAMNRDKDAYRKRAQEIRSFKANFVLERKNEMEKQINLEAVRHESALNELKGTYKRTLDSLKKEYKDYAVACYNEAYPTKILTKNYKKELKKLTSEYQRAKDLAKIIFFFKTNDLVTLCTDEISNKMVQSLGIKVFTKQYMLEIPHDAYTITSDDGIELEVLETINYGTKNFLHCKTTDTLAQDVYIETTESYEKSSKIKICFEISKIHITEKSMEIKIY